MLRAQTNFNTPSEPTAFATWPKHVLSLLALTLLSACTPSLMKPTESYDRLQQEIEVAKSTKSVVKPQTVDPITEALLPANSETFAVKEYRFDISMTSAPAQQVFNALVSGTDYSMLMPPEVTGNITLNLKNVTILEALESLRDVYGYDFSIKGKRILIQPNTLQSRLFKISYLTGTRGGSTNTSVVSSNVQASSGTSGTTTSQSAAVSVSTSQDIDFWKALSQNIAILLSCSIGDKAEVTCSNQKTFSLNSQAGILMVRAMPSELSEIERLINMMQASVDRQVMLEAKILEVRLNDGFQSGIDWAQLSNSALIRVNAKIGDLDSIIATPDSRPLQQGVGLSFSTSNFTSVIDFLRTQGQIYVMSSPRIATLNNQKAVLKVGSDEYFITDIQAPSVTGTGVDRVVTPPSIGVSPFFSGISLDITPQIDDEGMIRLHIRPAISEVSEKRKTIDFGDSGVYTLPYASTRVKEADSIVKIEDGLIVAIGGLMSSGDNNIDETIPGLGDLPAVGQLFKRKRQAQAKSELVILIKPTVIKNSTDWESGLRETSDRMHQLDPRTWPQSPVLAAPPAPANH